MGAGNGGAVSGRGAGFSVVNKFGVNFDIDTASVPETIWAHGGSFPFLDTGIAMDVVSGAAADNIAGTGARKARVTYYTTDNTEVVQTFDLTGLTPVEVAADIKLCTRIEIIETGSGNTNAGEVNLVDRATGLVVYQSVEIGEGQTLSAVQICPKGKRGTVICHEAAYAKAQSPLTSADMRFNLRKVDGSILAKHVTLISISKSEDKKEYQSGSGIEVLEGEIVYWECLAVGSNDTPIEARFDMELVDI